MVRGCDTRDRRAYSRVGGDLERATGGRRGEGRRSLRRRRNGDEHSHGSEDPLGSTSWEHGRGSATRVGQLSSRGTGKGESSLSLSNLSLVLPSLFPHARVPLDSSSSRGARNSDHRANLPLLLASFHLRGNVPDFLITQDNREDSYPIRSSKNRHFASRWPCPSLLVPFFFVYVNWKLRYFDYNNVITGRKQFISTS